LEVQQQGQNLAVIYKELDPFEAKAQEQMAYYLRRAFGSSGEVDVINGLVLRSGDIRAQMHHLVIHSYGLLLIENVAVRGTINIEADWQWVNMHRGVAKPMRSPVTEIKLQALALEAFLDKKVKQKSFFHSLELDVLVDVPDTRAIQWAEGGAFPEVCNADQVPTRVIDRVAQCGHDAGKPGKLIPEQRRRLAEFLRASHKILPRLVPSADDPLSTRGSELGPMSGPTWAPSSRISDLG